MKGHVTLIIRQLPKAEIGRAHFGEPMALVSARSTSPTSLVAAVPALLVSLRFSSSRSFIPLPSGGASHPSSRVAAAFDGNTGLHSVQNVVQITNDICDPSP